MVSFKVDENLPAVATARLQEAGFDALSVHDQQLAGTTDENIAAVCKREQRAIVTLDLDFADIRTYPPEEYFGIVVFRLNQLDRQHVLNVLEQLLPKLREEELVGKLWIVSEQSIRIRD